MKVAYRKTDTSDQSTWLNPKTFTSANSEKTDTDIDKTAYLQRMPNSESIESKFSCLSLEEDDYSEDEEYSFIEHVSLASQ